MARSSIVDVLNSRWMTTLLVVLVLWLALQWFVPAADRLAGLLEPPALPEAHGLTELGVVDETWSVRALDGTTKTMASLRGRVVLIGFWATWCVPCVAELPSFVRLRDSVRGEPIDLLLVTDEDPGKVKRFLADRGFDLPVYVSDGPVPAAFAAPGVPATFIVDRNGSVVYRHVGAADWGDETVRRFLLALTAPTD